jgi:hypothetical protein
MSSVVTSGSLSYLLGHYISRDASSPRRDACNKIARGRAIAISIIYHFYQLLNSYKLSISPIAVVQRLSLPRLGDAGLPPRHRT